MPANRPDATFARRGIEDLVELWQALDDDLLATSSLDVAVDVTDGRGIVIGRLRRLGESDLDDDEDVPRDFFLDLDVDGPTTAPDPYQAPTPSPYTPGGTT